MHYNWGKIEPRFTPSRPYRVEHLKARTSASINKIVFISSRLRGDSSAVVEENIRKAEDYCRKCYELGMTPLAPHVYLPHFLTVGDEKHDAFASEFSRYWIVRANEFWCCDTDGMSEGMREELSYAVMCGKPILYASKGELDFLSIGN